MLEQGVRQLRDGEHEHQVEEQLDEGRLVVLVPIPAAQHVRCRISAGHGSPLRWLLLKSYRGLAPVSSHQQAAPK